MRISNATSVTDLPIEVVFRIFSLLDVYDLLAVSSLNRTCHAIFEEHLQFYYELKAAGVINGAPLMDIGGKLQALRLREERWRTLDMTRHQTVDIPHDPSNLYDLSSGFYVLGGVQGNHFFSFIEKKTKYLRVANLFNYHKDDHDDAGNDATTELVGKKADNGEWGEIKANGNSLIVDFGLCIDEHDLIGVVEVTPSRGERPIKLHLRQFSTGEYHASAKKPVVDLGVSRSGWGKMSMMMEVVGPYLLLLLSWSSNEEEGDDDKRDRLLLIDWKSGEKLVEEQSRTDVWDGVVFLTPHIFVVTNTARGCLEVISILQNLPNPSAATESEESHSQPPRTAFTRLMSFTLPEPVADFRYYSISCRADPNPFGIEDDGIITPGTEKSRRALFSNDPEKAIVIFRIILRADAGFIRTSFVVHRASMMHHVYKAHPWILSDSLPPHELSEPIKIDWDTWGPPSTRWVFDEAFHTQWITTTSGQREVFMRGEPSTIVVRDYNPVAVRRAIWEKKNGTFDDMGGRRAVITDSEPLSFWPHVFTNNGTHALPYIEVDSEEEFDYDGVLMDETHLLGLNRSDDSIELANFDVYTF
ncbi:hypothetical protein SCHPADRAFT_901780 [Schizopora paradoxa]|uniref:F-box domain-containing protein n=1 Tax=Schizopora paradoxa TaxID=27342 RepID=A0A0H2S2W8_9AGAM|nr:hypothetical protein SCHPADRAFT_901780 [Schizopora paradoxa]